MTMYSVSSVDRFGFPTAMLSSMFGQMIPAALEKLKNEAPQAGRRVSGSATRSKGLVRRRRRDPWPAPRFRMRGRRSARSTWRHDAVAGLDGRPSTSAMPPSIAALATKSLAVMGSDKKAAPPSATSAGIESWAVAA
jgi:hypothetical protein